MLDRADTWEAVHPAWRPRLLELADRTGVQLRSVWRSRALQALWYWCANNNCPDGNNCHGSPGACPGANPPDLSFHECAEEFEATVQQVEAAGLIVADSFVSGRVLVPCSLAVDLMWNTTAQINDAHALAPELGLHFPIFTENWHVQPVEAPQSISPSRWWSPFPSLTESVHTDPWAGLFPILIR